MGSYVFLLNIDEGKQRDGCAENNRDISNRIVTDHNREAAAIGSDRASAAGFKEVNEVDEQDAGQQ